MMGKTADKTSLRKRAAALLAAAALASALGFGAAFAGDEAGGALEVNDVGVVQADGAVSDDAASGGAGAAATGASTGSAAVGEASDSVAAEEAAAADAGSNAAAEELPLPDDCGGAYLKGAVAFTNVAPLVGSASAEPADDGRDGNVAAYAAAGFAAVADDLLAAFAGDAGVATLEEDAPEDGGDGSDADSGLVLDKTAKANENGTYTITLEAYATGEQTTVSSYDPADVVLVLDTSASMLYPMNYDDSDFTAVYGNTSRKNYDSLGNSANGAYAVDDHNCNDKVSSTWTYYIKINNEYVKVGYNDYGTNSLYGGWSYKNSAGNWVGHLIPKTSEKDNDPNHVQFYKLDMSKTRLATLKTAVNSFVSNVLKTSPESSIAIVPFGGSVGTTVGFTSDETVLTNAVNALSATGATNSGAAMTTAASMINSLDASHSGHKKVVVMFTDGAPTTSSAFDSEVANTAIGQSKTMKGNGVTVYTVGVLEGANGALLSMGTSDINTYMHSVSSNYPEASNMTSSGKVNENLNGDSYYLTATNSDELKNIFVKISQQVGGADNTTLGSSTVVKDVIAPSFVVPENASDVEIYTADCTNVGTDGELIFDYRTKATDVTAAIDEDTLDVTGFDFSANWCGSHSGTYGGKKLIIEFTVSPKEGFLGGNDVPTNGAASGVYVGTECITTFEVPTVNVPIEEIAIEASDKNVYLTQIPVDEQLRSGVTVKCGGVDITDPSKLEDWQKAYVTVDSSFSTSDGFDATADGSYTVAASVKPNVAGYSDKPGTVATDQAESETKTINVFKPELTFKDSEVWYGDAAPTYYSVNKTEEVWKHGETLSTAVIMLGDKPTLGLKYAPNADQLKTEGGVKYVDSKQDIPVDVTVKIGTTDVTDKTRFVHAKCSEAEDDPVDGKFWLHVNTCSLTIEKKAASGTTFADDEYFVFDVEKDGEPYTQATVEGAGSVTITGLPVGTYAVSEDAAAAWRYTSSFDNDSVTLGNGNPCATVTCTNTLRDGRWLNALSSVVNTYGVFNGKSGAASLLAALLG